MAKVLNIIYRTVIALYAVYFTGIAFAAPIPTSGTVALIGKHEYATPTEVNGFLAISGSGEAKFTHRNQTSLLRVRGGDTLRIDDLTSRQVMWQAESGAWQGNRAVELWRGSKFVAHNWKIADGGTGLHIWACDEATITGAKIVYPTYGYNFYLGSLQDGLKKGDFENYIADNVTISGAELLQGRRETALRAMGSQRTYIKNSTVTRAWKDNKTNKPNGWHQKEVLQLRHMRGGVFENRIDGAIIVGELDPSINNGIHFTVGERFPTYIEFAGNTRRGPLKVTGNSFVIVDGDKVIGRDPSGGYGGTAFSVESYTHNGVKHQPTHIVVNTHVIGDGWMEFAGGGVIVGPNCTLNGKAVPPSKSFNWKEFNRIRAERKVGW